MQWIIQNNLYQEEQDFEIIRQTFSKFNIPYQEVKLLNGTITPDLEVSGPAMIIGGYSLMRYAINHKITPGCFTDNMDMPTWIEHYQDNMLNFNAKILPLREVHKDGPFFIRPTQDSKEFGGLTFDSMEDFEQWRLDTLATSSICTEHTSVVVSDLKCIHRETRFFIINKKIISASAYKINGTIRTSPYINTEETQFVEKMISLWTPNKAFVMDVATTDFGLKIIELNCINCSGFYEADIQKIIMTLDTEC